MSCARCKGLMVTDRFIDLEETGHLWMSGWRCMNCGHVADPVTEQNRKLQAQGHLGAVNVPKTTKGIADLSQPVSIPGHESQAA